MRRFVLLLILLPALAPLAFAQPTNMQALQTLAVECVDFLAADQNAVEINTTERMPFLRSAIVSWLNEKGRTVYLADSVYTDRPTHLNKLNFQVESSRIAYKRLRKKKAHRTVSLTAKASLISSKGQILADETCQQSFEDTITLSDIPSLESSSYAETRGTPPKAGFGRRVLQPFMLVAATTLSVYLFFTLRSESSDDGS